MNCTYRSIVESNRDLEQMWIQERFSCLNQVQFFDFIYIYIFKLKQSAFKMSGIIFASIFFYVNGTQLIFENFLYNDLVVLLDYYKHFEYVAAFVFIFSIQYFSEFVKQFQITNGIALRPPNHTFAYFMSSTVISLTFGSGFVYLLTKNKIRIPYYTTYLHFAAMVVFILFFLLCSFVGAINYYLLLLPFAFYCAYIYFLFKFSTFDKFLEEKFRTTVYKDEYDLAYYYEPLTKEQLEALNKKKERKKVNLDDLSDSDEDEEIDQEAIKKKQNEFKQILLQQLEDEFKEKPTLLEKIERDLEIDENKNILILTIERWVLIVLCLFMPSQKNFLTKTHMKILVQYFGFCVGLTNLPGMKLQQVFASAFFATVMFYSVLYFLSSDLKKMVKSIVAVFIVLSITNFISRIFLDIFLLLGFFFNLEKIDGEILKGVFRIVPIMILTYVLAKRDRLILGYAILNVTIVGIVFITIIIRFHNLIQYNLVTTDLKQLYKQDSERLRVSGQLSLMLFFSAFLILLHLIYLYMKDQIGNKTFGQTLIAIGLVYVVSNIMLII